eukprot:Awhi_evm1s7033
MITTKPSKFELSYVILFVLDVNKVVNDFVTPTIIMYCVECAILFFCFCVTLFRLLFFISSSYQKHPAVKVLRDSTVLLTVMSFGKALCNILATYYAHDHPTEIGTISALSDGIAHFNIPMKIIIVILYCRLGEYIQINASGTSDVNGTSRRSKNDSRYQSRADGKSQLSARERTEEIIRVVDLHEVTITEEVDQSSLVLACPDSAYVYDGSAQAAA